MHDYFDVDYEIVWFTVAYLLPDLQEELELILTKENK
ncbi:MAG: hypothetical protein IPJ74_09710 [Saprospiraceae bacterium]|nr:hypothetical protein [Saprospiraceae bacterium]